MNSLHDITRHLAHILNQAFKSLVHFEGVMLDTSKY